MIRTRNKIGRFERENTTIVKKNFWDFMETIFWLINIIWTLVKLIPLFILVWYSGKYFNLRALFNDIMISTICNCNDSPVTAGNKEKNGYFN